MNITGIRDALEDTIGVLDVHAYGTMPDSPNVPAVIVHPDDPFVNYQEAMQGGLVSLHFILEILVPSVALEDAHQTLDAILSAGNDADPLSLFNMFFAKNTDGSPNQNRNLGGLVSDMVITAASGYSIREDANQNTRWIGTDVSLTVYLPRN